MLTEQEVEMNDTLTGEDVFETPEFEVPASKPDLHRGTVTEVTLRRLNNEKGTVILSIGLASKDVPTLSNMKLDLFLPKDWEQYLGESKFDRSVLPNEEGNKQQANYIRTVANGDKTAPLQRYVFNKAGVATDSKGKEFQVKDSIARAAGRNPAELGLSKATTFEEYAENVNKMLQGVDVLIVRREKGGDDPAFKHNLEPKDIFSIDEIDTNPKKFRNYVKAWE